MAPSVPSSHFPTVLLLAGVTVGIALGGPTAARPEDEALQPIVRQRVEARVYERSMTLLALSAPMRLWQPGDPVRVVEDLKERLAPASTAQGDDSEGDGSADQKPMVREPVASQEMSSSVRSLPAAPVWQPGDPVRVLSDLRLATPATATPATAAPVPVAGVAFDGIPASGALPPDTVGDVGPNHYVQMVNSAFSIYDKQGNLLAGPAMINSLWSGFGGPCEMLNNGDPIVRYDALADRWLLSQFALVANDNRECVAISRSPDPVNGGWFLYAFPTQDRMGASVFPDYPKIGVWPDGYYMGTQRGFPNGGLDVWAFERDQMLVGAPAAMVQFSVAAPSIVLMPGDLDGPPPPAGTPNFFVRQVDGQVFGGQDRVEVYAFDVDWANPAASTFLQVANLPTAPFDSNLCGGGLLGACIPQPGTAVRLESLTPWPMWRAQFRDFGDRQILLTNHTVDIDGNDHAGVRWYELRRSGGVWSIFQQGTHGTDDLHRWMASVAMDGQGDIAAGFSVSSGTVFPGLRAAVRAPGDPAGTLPVELDLIAGGGSQTHTAARWGNYSTMDVDPLDDCTFWFTSEYMATTSAAGWRTRVASFRLPGCGRPPVIGEEEPATRQYAAKLACGVQRDPKDMRLARGFYASTINIHNPKRKAVTLSKRLALSFPPGEERPGEVFTIARQEILGPDQALEVDCNEVRERFFAGGFSAGYIEGFVVVESSDSLDVVGVYSTAALDRDGVVTTQSGIAVERVPERRLEPAP